MLGAYLDQVDFRERLIIAWFLDIQNGDDVLVIEVAQQFHFSQCSQTEHRMIERCDLLDRDLLPRRLVQSGAIPVSI